VLVRHLSPAELTEYADTGIAGSRRAEAHLRSCRACAQALEQARASTRVLLALPPVSGPYDLRQRIVARLDCQPLPQLACREALALIHESLDARLSPLVAGFLRLHLDICPECRLEFATLTEATRAVRSLAPVLAPLGVREAARARRVVPAPWSVRLRPAFASAAVAAVALFLALRSSPQQVAPPRRLDTRPPGVAAVPSPSVPPEVSEPEEQQPDLAQLAQAVVMPLAAPRLGLPESSHAATRPIRHLTLIAAGPSPEPVAIAARPPSGREVGPAALRALRSIARAATTDSDSHVSLAMAGERFATLDSEARAAAFPSTSADLLPAGEPSASPTPTRDHRSGALNSTIFPNQAGLMEGTSKVA